MMVLGVMRVKTATFRTANQKANAKKSTWSQVTNCSFNDSIYTIAEKKFAFKDYKLTTFYFKPVFVSIKMEELRTTESCVEYTMTTN